MNTKSNRYFWTTIYLLTILVLYSTLSYAQLESEDLPDREGVEAEMLLIHSAFKTEVQLDTNIFLESEKPEFDVVTILNPQVGFELPLGKNLFSADYSMKRYLFGVYKDQSYWDHTVRMLGEINLTDYTISILNKYRYFSDRSGSEDVNRVKRQNNYLEPRIKAQFDQLGFDAGYSFGIEDFIANNLLFASPLGDLRYQDKSRYVHEFDLEGSYRFMPKTSALLETKIGFLNFMSPLSSDSWYTQIVAGLRGDLTERFSANIKGGVKYQGYDRCVLRDAEDFFGFVASGGVAYEAPNQDEMSILVERAVYESTFANMNYYTVNHVGYEYKHKFGRKVEGTAYGFYQINLYPDDAMIGGVTAKRYDNFFGFRFSLRYDINKWFMVEAKYDYTHRKSRFGTFNYKDNLFTVNATAGF